ncbi:hypothetical protein, partial [Xanthomonas phaseoli]|uniref:hypothetical protein n=1 Tax=Xanthomonas phaseoli TaxID=1985254 RepID=UPI001ED95507
LIRPSLGIAHQCLVHRTVMRAKRMLDAPDTSARYWLFSAKNALPRFQHRLQQNNCRHGALNQSQ